MPDPAQLRDSTQIVLPSGALAGVRDELEAEHTVTVVQTHHECRIIGSPVEIKAAGEFLARRGVTID